MMRNLADFHVVCLFFQYKWSHFPHLLPPWAGPGAGCLLLQHSQESPTVKLYPLQVLSLQENRRWMVNVRMWVRVNLKDASCLVLSFAFPLQSWFFFFFLPPWKKTCYLKRFLSSVSLKRLLFREEENSYYYPECLLRRRLMCFSRSVMIGDIFFCCFLITWLKILTPLILKWLFPEGGKKDIL